MYNKNILIFVFLAVIIGVVIGWMIHGSSVSAVGGLTMAQSKEINANSCNADETCEVNSLDSMNGIYTQNIKSNGNLYLVANEGDIGLGTSNSEQEVISFVDTTFAENVRIVDDLRVEGLTVSHGHNAYVCVNGETGLLYSSLEPCV